MKRVTKCVSKWNADAEAVLMGFVVPVQSEEHLKTMLDRVLTVLRTEYHYEVDEKSQEVFESAVHKYNSEDIPVKYFTVNTSPFGVLLTFVRGDEPLTSPDGTYNPEGNLAWVENLDAPDCSELGYVFFQKDHGKVHRIS